MSSLINKIIYYKQCGLVKKLIKIVVDITPQISYNVITKKEKGNRNEKERIREITGNVSIIN